MRSLNVANTKQFVTQGTRSTVFVTAWHKTLVMNFNLLSENVFLHIVSFVSFKLLRRTISLV